MIKCKKRISSAMVAVFTTIMVLSSTNAGAITAPTAASLLAAAKTSVSATQYILSTSAYDLAVNQKSLSKANTAIIKAKKSIDLLNQTTADYKILNGKIMADLVRMMSAHKNIVAVKATEAVAILGAEKAIKAVEVAPTVTAANKTALKVLQTTATVALLKVKGSVSVMSFTARLKVVADELAAL